MLRILPTARQDGRLSAGPERVTDSLRMALAMGADSAMRLDLPGDADSSMNARALAAAIGKLGSADIVFTGKEAIDDGAAAVGQVLAVLLDMPCVTVVNGINYADGAITCRRDVGGGSIEVIESQLPAVVADGLTTLGALPPVFSEKVSVSRLTDFKLVGSGACNERAPGNP